MLTSKQRAILRGKGKTPWARPVNKVGGARS